MICANKRYFTWSGVLELRPCTHEQIKYHLFAQILTDLLQTNPKLAQIKVTLFAHVC